MGETELRARIVVVHEVVEVGEHGGEHVGEQKGEHEGELVGE